MIGESRRADYYRGEEVSAAETTIFVYDSSSQLIAEYSTTVAETQQVSYLTTDHLGSPRVITNESGAVTSRKDFTAFGEESVTAQRTSTIGYSGVDEIRKGYAGYEKDDESGLDFAQARYYNSVHGRYTSVDPLTASASIKDPQTFNRYSYVLNSPYKFTDPLGLIPETTGACGSRCRGSASLLPGGDGAYGAFTGRNPFNQHAEEPDPPPTPDDPPYFIRDKDENLQKIDQEFTSILTDTGTVLGASSPMFRSGFNHYKFSDGKVHTLHIFGNDAANADAGVYIPKDFTEVTITRKDTVVATNPKTGEVLLIAHVKVGTSLSGLKKNMKTVRENGTVYIGQIGGKGGAGDKTGRGRHAHLVLFPSENSRLEATTFKANLMEKIPNTADYTPEISRHLADFRTFVKKEVR